MIRSTKGIHLVDLFCFIGLSEVEKAKNEDILRRNAKLIIRFAKLGGVKLA